MASKTTAAGVPPRSPALASGSRQVRRFDLPPSIGTPASGRGCADVTASAARCPRGVIGDQEREAGAVGHADRSNCKAQKIGRPRPFQVVVDLLFPQPRGPVEEVSRVALLCPSVVEQAGCSQSRLHCRRRCALFPKRRLR
jgi:hypothetical protein